MTEEEQFEAENPVDPETEPKASVTIERQDEEPREMVVEDPGSAALQQQMEQHQELVETKPDWFKPADKVSDRKKLRELVEWQLPALVRQMPRHFRADRVVSAVLMATNQTPALLNCTQGSWAQALIVMGQTGLELGGVAGEAYLVPFNEKVAGTNRYEKRVRFMPGYRGLARLARNSGDIERIEAHVVYEKDLWEFELGLNPQLRHVPNFDEEDRGGERLAYAIATFKDGSYQAEVMSRGEIEKVRNSGSSANSPAWTNWWSEMARKTVFKRLSKWLPWDGDPAMTAALLADAHEAAVEIRGKTDQMALTQESLRALPMPSDEQEGDGSPSGPKLSILPSED